MVNININQENYLNYHIKRKFNQLIKQQKKINLEDIQ
jgi:hypothetical protein